MTQEVTKLAQETSQGCGRNRTLTQTRCFCQLLDQLRVTPAECGTAWSATAVALIEPDGIDQMYVLNICTNSCAKGRKAH